MIAPPKRLQMPGYSFKIAHTNNGASIVSSKIKSDASVELIYLGPMARKHVPIAIKTPCTI